LFHKVRCFRFACPVEPARVAAVNAHCVQV
jgi:hypothetical protein